MKLNQLIEVKISFEERVKQELLKMVTHFHDYMWNGFDEENDPKFVTQEDYEAIEALADKIEHMIFHIGCPNSVEPMLISICQRKIKHWQAHDNVETKDVTEYRFNSETKEGRTVITKRGFKKGRQLRTKADLSIVANTDGYSHIPREKRIIKGHFRWNNRGYILSRKATDVLALYLQTKFF